MIAKKLLSFRKFISINSALKSNAFIFPRRCLYFILCQIFFLYNHLCATSRLGQERKTILKDCYEVDTPQMYTENCKTVKLNNLLSCTTTARHKN